MSRSRAMSVISVASGKGGVGKTMTTIHLAMAAVRFGRKVLVIDGDLGLANVDVVMGLASKGTLRDVIEGQLSLQRILLRCHQGFDILPGGSGFRQMTQLSYIQRLQLMDEIEQLENDYDLLLVDTGAGISETVIHMNGFADRRLVVTTPEPHAMTDAYAMIKVMFENFGSKDIQLLVNMSPSQSEADRVYARLAQVCDQFLGFRPSYAGFIPFDQQLSKQVMQRSIGGSNAVHTLSGQAWLKIGRQLFDEFPKRSSENVWRELVWTQQQSLMR